VSSTFNLLKTLHQVAEETHQFPSAKRAPTADNRDELAKLRDMIEAGSREGQINEERYAALKGVMEQVGATLEAPDADPNETVATLTRLRALVDEVTDQNS